MFHNDPGGMFRDERLAEVVSPLAAGVGSNARGTVTPKGRSVTGAGADQATGRPIPEGRLGKRRGPRPAAQSETIAGRRGNGRSGTIALGVGCR